MHWIICGEGINRQIICLETGTSIRITKEPHEVSSKYWYELTMIGVSEDAICSLSTYTRERGQGIKIISDEFRENNKYEKEIAQKQAIEALKNLAIYLKAKPIESVLGIDVILKKNMLKVLRADSFLMPVFLFHQTGSNPR